MKYAHLMLTSVLLLSAASCNGQTTLHQTTESYQESIEKGERIIDKAESKVTLISSLKDFSDVITSSDPVLIELYAAWCPHCQKFAPIMDQIATSLLKSSSIKSYRINLHNPEIISTLTKYLKKQDENGKEILHAQKIQPDHLGFPTLFLFKKGQLLMAHVGDSDPAEKIVKNVRSALKLEA